LAIALFLITTLPSKLDSTNDCSLSCAGAADVERAHRQLRAGLADRLRRNDADRFAVVDRRAAARSRPIALAADALTSSQVSAERIFTSWMAPGECVDMRLASISVSALDQRPCVVAHRAESSHAVRPRMRDASESDDGAASTMARILMHELGAATRHDE